MNKPKQKLKPLKRRGHPSNAEKSLIRTFVEEQKHEVTEKQVTALAKVLERTPEGIRKLVQDARDDFSERAKRYADIHVEATELALANGDSRSLGVAAKASQWALQNISHEGVRVIEKETVMPTMPRIMIGVKIGGVDLDAVQAGESVIVTSEPV